MLTRASIESLDRDALIDLVLAQAEQNAALQKQVDRLQRRLDRPGGFRRDSTEPAKKSTSTTKKSPGRKPGEGTFSRREAPDPSSYTTHEHLERTDRHCPKCSGRLLNDGYETVTITDLPALVLPQVEAFALERCLCAECGHRLRAEHPRVSPGQRGATAHRLGDRIAATAFWLHYQLGIPQSKLPQLFGELFSTKLTTSAITQATARFAKRTLRPIAESLREDLAKAPFVHTDDTSWRVAGQPAWLMGFFSDETCLYRIRDAHRHQEVLDVVEADYSGTLVTDRFSSYDHSRLSGIAQQKCLAHVQRNLKDHIVSQPTGSRELPHRIKQTFAEAIELHRRYHNGKVSEQRYRRAGAKLIERLDRLLAPRRIVDEANASLVYYLGRHHDRGNLVRFLGDPSIPPTNNEAERMLRPGVIARKVSHGSASWLGAETRGLFLSVLQTLRRRCDGSLLDALLSLLRGGTMPALAASR